MNNKMFRFEVTGNEYELIYKGLLELPGKYTINLLIKLDEEFSSQAAEYAKQLELEFKENPDASV